MAASELTVQNVTMDASLTPAFDAANADGNFFTNTGRILLYAKNGSGSPIVMTIVSQTDCNQGATHDIEVTIPAGSEEMVGFFSNNRFNDSDGYAQITYSDVTTLTIGVMSVAN